MVLCGVIGIQSAFWISTSLEEKHLSLQMTLIYSLQIERIPQMSHAHGMHLMIFGKSFLKLALLGSPQGSVFENILVLLVEELQAALAINQTRTGHAIAHSTSIGPVHSMDNK